MTDTARKARVTPITAAYASATSPVYTANPFIDALPPIRSAEDWLSQLLYAPTHNPAHVELDAHHRAYLVAKLRQLFIPTPQHVKLAMRLDQMIRWGYEGRNPRSPERAALLQSTYERAQLTGKSERAVFRDFQPICTFSLIGCSGVGKSTSTERVLAAYPQVIHHPIDHTTQVVWLKVECPKGGSVKELALSIMAAFDRTLGTAYAPDRGMRLTADSLTRRVNHLAVAHNLGILVLDELQNLSSKKSGGREEMLNWFQELVNDMKLPIALLGTFKARNVLQLDLRHARRTTVSGSEHWDRLKKGEEFNFLMRQIWRYQLLREPGELTEELREVIYEETQGIRAFMVDMFLIAQLHALWKGSETVTPKLFKRVARTEFAAVQPMLNALRSGDPLRLSKFDDLVSYDMEQQIQQFQCVIPRPAADLPADKGGLMIGEASANIAAALTLPIAEAKALVLRVYTGTEATAAGLTRAAMKLFFELQEENSASQERLNNAA